MRSFKWLNSASKLPCNIKEFGKALGKESATRTLQNFTNPCAQPSELVKLSAALLPHVNSHAYSIVELYKILKICSERSIRYEPTLFRCVWNILKVDVPQNSNYNTADGLCLGMTPTDLAFYTAETFCIISQMQLINDRQILALAFGRCIELSSVMSLNAVAKTYDALRALNREYFSLTEVFLHDSNMDTISTIQERLEEVPLSSASNQPNLVDVLCGELEARLAQLCGLRLGPTDSAAHNKAAENMSHCSHELLSASFTRYGCAASDSYPLTGSRIDLIPYSDLFSCMVIIHALRVVGCSSPDLFSDLRSIIEGCGGCEGVAISLELLIQALGDISHVHPRIVDPLRHEDSPHFAEARGEMIRFLSSCLLRKKDLVLRLRRDARLNLEMRRLFEESESLTQCAFPLWDQIRSIRVAQKHLSTRRKSTLPRCQLFDRHNTRLKEVMLDLSEAERFVPSQFKKWRSPQHSPRRNRSACLGNAKVIPFGMRRIPRDFIKKKQQKYCRQG